MEVVVVLVVLAVLAIAILVALQKSSGKDDLPVKPRSLMSARERMALEAIEACMPNCRVYPQVAMGALIEVRGGVDRSRGTSVRNSFDRKRVDFVLEERSSGKVLAIVEVDDRTHSPEKDARRDRLTSAAGYRTIRIPAGSKLDVSDVRDRLMIGLATDPQALETPRSSLR